MVSFLRLLVHHEPGEPMEDEQHRDLVFVTSGLAVVITRIALSSSENGFTAWMPTHIFLIAEEGKMKSFTTVSTSI
jgi:hypothetical protein